VKVRDLKISCDVVVVGGGAVGAFATLDLTLRGVKTVLLERRYVCSGTSGRSHGMLHSGARYVASDERAARECISENTILSRIAPHCVRDVGGIFVSVSESDEDYHSILLNGCHRAGIPAREMDRDNLAALEPNISPEARTAILVPDKIVYARDLVTTVLLASIGRGATVLEEAEVAKIRVERGEVVGVEAYSHGGPIDVSCRAIVNAAGPWAGRVAALAGVGVEVVPTAGVMGVAPANLTRHILNRMRPPSDGDIIVPYASGASIVGTTAKLVEDPEDIEVKDDDEKILLEEGSAMVPALKSIGFSRFYASARPLIMRGGEEWSPRKSTRSFEIIDHSADGAAGLFTAAGGKLTTCRLEAEEASKLVSAYIGAPGGSFTGNLPLSELDQDWIRSARELLRSGELPHSLSTLLAEALKTIDAERDSHLLRRILLLQRLRGVSA
jgi:glycerol-3-phosphate dehydrogenase